MALDALLLRLDRIAGGRQAGVRVAAAGLSHPKTRRAFRWITWLLVLELLIGLAAAVAAVWITAAGGTVPLAVWMRSFVVLAMTATLCYFAWRAARGWYWAYRRLRLFAQIFPVITLVMAAIPGLYPGWMITEQIIFSLIMIGIGDFLRGEHLSDVFRVVSTDDSQGISRPTDTGA
ncbi:hypothetical protein [Leucobacter musarum]|uniref:hypothetical protein n=1 Tax=Leucobacter musarum TaxID=1930747 RepID=UPI0006A77BDC|nr:hypothetical protein [Leucobacter musarum]